MKLQKQPVYLPVSVDSELPELGNDVLAFNYGDEWQSECRRIEIDGKIKWINSWDDDLIECHPTNWLKKEDRFVFSEEDLRELLDKVADITVGYLSETPPIQKILTEYKKEYINNLLKQD